MKAIITLLSCLGVCLALVQQADAVQFTLNEESSTRLDFSLDWSHLSGVSLAGSNGSGGSAGSEDRMTDLVFGLDISRDGALTTKDGFYIELRSDRTFKSLVGFDGAQYLIDDDGLGGRFIYGAALTPQMVFDSGSTILLLSIAGCGLWSLLRLRRGFI